MTLAAIALTLSLQAEIRLVEPKDGASVARRGNPDFSEESSCKVTVDPDKVEAEVPRTLYGTGMEDVNHEIYGGLDAQRLYDESFEETEPRRLVPRDKEGRHFKICGRQWEPVLFGGGAEALDRETVHLGRQAQALIPNGGTAGIANRGLNGWGVPCREGRKMVGRFFLRGTVDRLEVALQRGDGLVTYATAVVPSAGGDGWRRVDFELVPNVTDPQGRFLVRASGRGKVWIDDAYLADEPTNEFGRLGCREDIVEGFRREGITFLRWGGSMANSPEYMLRNMRGDRRPYAGLWLQHSSTGFLVREFVQMAAAMHLPCAFSIQAYDTVEDAVELARWLARFDIALYVQIGNEECAGFNPSCGPQTIESVRRYGASVRRLVPPMRAANPRLTFVSAVMWLNRRIDLMEEAFRQTDGFCEYWDLHVGADDVNSGACARNVFRTFRELIARINPKSTMKAAVFEENGSIHDMRRALAHASILEAAREQGDFLLTSCPANALQPYCHNDNGWDQGQIFFTTDKVWLQPCAWAQQMASANHRDLLVKGSAGGGVTVSATRDRAATSLVLHLLNPAGVSKPVVFDLRSACTWTLAKVTSLSAPRLDAHNPPDDPERVAPVDATAAFRREAVLKPNSYTVVEFHAQSPDEKGAGR